MSIIVDDDSENSELEIPSEIIGGRYLINDESRLGAGGFGQIYLGFDQHNEDLEVAIKFEQKNGKHQCVLRHEYKVHRELRGSPSFCSVYLFNDSNEKYNVLIMERLGPNLDNLFGKCDRKFSLGTILKLTDQMLDRITTMHSKYLVHRDVKPGNFVIGREDNANTLYIIDFGLSKLYGDRKKQEHYHYRDSRQRVGTPRYASIYSQLGIEQTRRDDLESIAYIIIYFIKGRLPWQGLIASSTKEKQKLILKKKQEVSIAELCEGCPPQVAAFLTYVRRLGFSETPNIAHWRNEFRSLYLAEGYDDNTPWDWESPS